VISNPPVELTDLSQVERALAASRAGGPGSVRATTLNLVAYAPTPDDVAFTQRALERIGGSRPLRAIIAGTGPNGVRATVSASCWLGSGLQQVCSEQVLLTARADALPSAVVSLLVPDLPTFVWWQGPIAQGLPLLSELAMLGTSAIVDSNVSSLEGVDGVRQIEPAVTDLAWLRLESWREAVASLFDPPVVAAALGDLAAAHVDGPINEARLLAGWLGSRLDRRVDLTHSERPHVERVKLACGRSEFVVERHTRVQVGRAYGTGVSEHPVVLPLLDPSVLLGRALDVHGSDPVFAAALATALAVPAS
jgi:glucose-6-phosphate dehydrogenase assembly protein OpcA